MKSKLLLAALLALICAASTIICCTKNSDDTETNSLEQIRSRGTLIIGTTGDYRPLSYREPKTGEYWGFGIEVAQKIAENIGVNTTFVQTSWPTLTEDVLKEPAILILQ